MEALRPLGGDEEARLFEDALAHFNDPAAFYALGYHFIEDLRETEEGATDR